MRLILCTGLYIADGAEDCQFIRAMVMGGRAERRLGVRAQTAADRCRAVEIYRFCHWSAQAPVLPAMRRCKRVWAGSLWRWCPLGPVVVVRGWLAGLWSGGWLQAGAGPVAGEVGLAGQGGPAEDGGEFCCLGSLAFPFGLDGREH